MGSRLNVMGACHLSCGKTQTPKESLDIYHSNTQIGVHRDTNLRKFRNYIKTWHLNTLDSRRLYKAMKRNRLQTLHLQYFQWVLDLQVIAEAQLVQLSSPSALQAPLFMTSCSSFPTHTTYPRTPQRVPTMSRELDSKSIQGTWHNSRSSVRLAERLWQCQGSVQNKSYQSRKLEHTWVSLCFSALLRGF